MVIDRQAMVSGHHRATVIGRRRAMAAIDRHLVMVSGHHPVGTIDLPVVVETGLRPEAAIVHRRMVAGHPAVAMEIVLRKAATARGPKPSPPVNKSHDKRRDYRGVCHLPHGHQPCPVCA